MAEEALTKYKPSTNGVHKEANGELLHAGLEGFNMGYEAAEIVEYHRALDDLLQKAIKRQEDKRRHGHFTMADLKDMIEQLKEAA